MEQSTIEAAPMCFACGQDNPIGLRIRFAMEDMTEIRLLVVRTPP